MKIRYLAAAAAVSATFTGVANAQTYSFTGTCADCTMPAGTLHLTGYTPTNPPTNPLLPSNFSSFTYTSSVYPYSVMIGGGSFIAYNNDLSGKLGTATGPYDVSFSGSKSYITALSETSSDGPPTPSIIPSDTYSFSSSQSGAWSFTENGTVEDHGTNGTWTLQGAAVAAAPEPETWALMLGGVAMVGAGLRLSRRRRLPLVA